ncbi:MAG: large subunit ribosomal protein [Planctomycetota bacterium]|nr:MAG: large subunit ribosomal protein [Planctomycetota bacterium]
MSTKVLLWQTVDKLGKRGDQVSVSDGYARNYLYPRKLATPATTGAAREFKAAARKAEKHEGDIKRQYSDLAAQIGNTHVTIEMLANNEGVLFGGVTPSAVADALKRAGLEVNGKFILIDAAIKRLGDYTVTVRFHPEVQSKLKVTVTASRAEQAAGAEADEENPFTKGISVDEAEKHDPKMRGKRPKKMKEGKDGKKEGAAAEGGGKAAGEKKAEVKEEKPVKTEKKKE